jgi:peptidoglycan hydrolase CwlO-like protein
VESELEGLSSIVAMNKSESEIQIAKLASKLEKTDEEINEVKNTFDEIQEEINSKLKENIDVVNQRRTADKLYAEKQYEGMQAEIREIKMVKRTVFYAAHSFSTT